jgi:hypothetical protein
VAVDEGEALAAVLNRGLSVLEVEKCVARGHAGVLKLEVDPFAGAQRVLARHEDFSADQQAVSHDDNLEDGRLCAQEKLLGGRLNKSTR